MAGHKIFHGNRMGLTGGSGKRKIVNTYVQRGKGNAWDKLRFRKKIGNFHPNGWKMLTLFVDILERLKVAKLWCWTNIFWHKSIMTFRKLLTLLRVSLLVYEMSIITLTSLYGGG